MLMRKSGRGLPGISSQSNGTEADLFSGGVAMTTKGTVVGFNLIGILDRESLGGVDDLWKSMI